MNKEEKLQKIREKIIEANPSIIELKFGCKLKSGIVVGQVYKEEWKCECVEVRKDWKNGFVMPIGEAEDEIIGRDISLCDCLLALKIDEVDGSDNRMSKAEALILMWNKYDNNLSEQDKPTIDLLYDILFNK